MMSLNSSGNSKGDKKRSPVRLFFRRHLPYLFFRLLFKNKPISSSKPPMHVAFLRPGKLGDMIVATPLFSLTRKYLKDCRITVICSPLNQTILSDNPDIDCCKVINFHSLKQVLGGIKWIQKEKVDLLIDLTPGISRTSAFMVQMCRKKGIRAAGMLKGRFSEFYDIHLHNTAPLHIVDRNVLLLNSSLGSDFSGINRPEIYFSSRILSESDSFLNSVCLKDKTVIGLNLSAGRPERQWSFQNYEKLINLILKNQKCSVLLFSTGSQRRWSNMLCEKYISLLEVPEGSFLSVVSLIKACRILVTPDTSFVHASSATGTPVTALYMAKDENFIRWKPYGVPFRTAISATGKINDITAEMVYECIDDLLKEISLHDREYVKGPEQGDN